MSTTHRKKIAFCFLIYDKMPHKAVWDHYFSQVPRECYTVYIHYKTNVPLGSFDSYKLSSCVPTRYAHVSIVEAQNRLLQDALQDEQNQHFVFLSDSCLPLKPFHVLYHSLQENVSYFHQTPVSQCFPRCNPVLAFVPRSCIQKASQWCILNRQHASLMVRDTRYLAWFKHVNAPDEHCYLTFLFYCGMQHEIVSQDHGTTFTQWSSRGLKTYFSLTQDDVAFLLSQPCFFARKFTAGCHPLSHGVYQKTLQCTRDCLLTDPSTDVSSS